MKIELSEILNHQNALMPLIHSDWVYSYLAKKKFLENSIRDNFSKEDADEWILRLEYSSGIWLLDSWRKELGPIKDWIVKKDLNIYIIEESGNHILWNRLSGHKDRLLFLKNSIHKFGPLYIPAKEDSIFDVYGKSNLIRRQEYLYKKNGNDKL